MPIRASRTSPLGRIASDVVRKAEVDLWSIEWGTREQTSSLCSPGGGIKAETASNSMSGELVLESDLSMELSEGTGQKRKQIRA